MKKFRLFAMLAVLATFSTVFAAWQYVHYDNEYKTDGWIITSSVADDTLTSAEAISIAVKADTSTKIVYSQSEEKTNVAVGELTSSFNVTVTEAEDGAMEKYKYYYALSGDEELGGFKKYDYYVTDGVVNYDLMKELTVDSNGEATISNEDIADMLICEFASEGADSDTFTAAFEAFKAKVTRLSPCMTVFAKKIA